MMRRRGVFWFLLFMTAFGLVPAVVAAASLPDTLDRVRPSIVGVATYLGTRSPPVVMTGTGFIVADGLHVITNAHVLPQKSAKTRGERLTVLVGKGKQASQRAAKLVGVDTDHDIALLKLRGKPLRPLRLASSGARVREGQRYAFTGFPIGMVLGLHPVTHEGIVSALTPIVIPQLNARSLSDKIVRRLGDAYTVYQLDATAYPGNSGSPLYETDSGRVVGVINKVLVKETKENLLDRPSGITYAIPVEFVRALLKKHRVPADGAS